MRTQLTTPLNYRRVALVFAAAFAFTSSLSAASKSLAFYEIPASSAITSVATAPAVTAVGFTSSASLAGYVDLTSNIQTASNITNKWLAWRGTDATLNMSKYIQFSVESAQAFSLDQFSFLPRNFYSQPGKIEVRFGTSLTDFNDSSVVIYNSGQERYTQIASNYTNTNNAGIQPISIDLSGIAGAQDITQGYFRIYVYDVINRGGETPVDNAWIGVSNVTISGAQIPEAGTTVSLLGAVCLGAVLCLRRRAAARRS